MKNEEKIIQVFTLKSILAHLFFCIICFPKKVWNKSLLKDSGRLWPWGNKNSEQNIIHFYELKNTRISFLFNLKKKFKSSTDILEIEMYKVSIHRPIKNSKFSCVWLIPSFEAKLYPREPLSSNIFPRFLIFSNS